jgi:O-antigen/teichoic acid export membrane protein
MIKQIIKLISSSALGQVITLAVLLSVARIVDVAVYGDYLVMLTIVTYIVVIASGKYHHVIFILNQSDAEYLASKIKYFCFLLALFSTVALFFLNKIFELWPEVSPKEFLVIGICGGLSANYLYYYYLSVKKNELRKIMKSRLISPLLGGVTMLLLAYFVSTSFSLLLGTLVTLVLSNYYLSISQKSPSSTNLFLILKDNKKFPLFLLPAGILETINASFLIISVNYFYGLEAAAIIGMYYRLIASPQGIICSAIGDIFRKRILELKSNVEILKKFYIKTLFILVLFSLLASFLFYIFSLYGVELLLGSKWKSSKDIFIIFIPVFFISFIVQPISSILYAANGQKFDLMIQILLSLMLLFLIFSHNQKSLADFLAWYVLVIMLKYFLELYFCSRCIAKSTF